MSIVRASLQGPYEMGLSYGRSGAAREYAEEALHDLDRGRCSGARENALMAAQSDAAWEDFHERMLRECANDDDGEEW